LELISINSPIRWEWFSIHQNSENYPIHKMMRWHWHQLLHMQIICNSLR